MFLALQLGITSGGAQGTIWNAEDETWVGCMQSKYSTQVLLFLLDVFKNRGK